jgi:hypothetical protein
LSAKSELAEEVDTKIAEILGSAKNRKTNFYTKEGAGVLAGKIRRFWRGHKTVRVWTEPINGYSELFTVKSNLVNALPPIEMEAAE